MSQNDLDYRAIRRNVEAGVQKQKRRARTGFFLGSIGMFLAFAFVAWVVFPATLPGFSANAGAFGSILMLTMGWLATLAFQGASLIFDTKAGEEQIRARLTAREIHREMMRLGADEDLYQEKAKRMMRLGEDGELVEIVEDPSESDQRRASS